MNHTSVLIRIGFLAMLLTCDCLPANALAEVQFTASPVTTVMSAEQMDGYGLMIPDEPLGFIKTDKKGIYDAYTAGGSVSGVGKAAHLQTGTYKYTGTLDDLRPVITAGKWPSYGLTAGSIQPSPDGSDFDRDYGGGGPTYDLSLLEGKPGDGTSKGSFTHASLLQLYHGEYHYNHPRGLPAYGGCGLALSTDGGASFEKLGQILYPHLSRDEYLHTNPTGGLWADAMMVEADKDGHPIAQGADGKQGAVYFYFIFSERNTVEEKGGTLALARIEKKEFLDAVRRKKAPVIHKYYNPGGKVASRDASFTEPGIGGSSTPVIVPPRGSTTNTPYLVYSAPLGRFVLAYQSSQKRIILQTSEDLFEWSQPVEVLTLDPASDQRLYNPTLVGVDGEPKVLGNRFYVYFLQRTIGDNRRLSEPRLERIEVTMSGAP